MSGISQGAYCNDEECYEDGERYALVISITEDRPGAERDEIRLTKVLERFNFSLDVCTGDLTSEQIKKAIYSFKEKLRTKTVGACGIFVMSHGLYEDGVEMIICKSTEKSEDDWSEDKTCKDLSDNTSTDYLSVMFVIEQFNRDNASFLVGIPKIFILNLCRGKKEDQGLVETPNRFQFTEAMKTLHDSYPETDRVGEHSLNSYHSREINSDYTRIRYVSRPCRADMLVGRASDIGYVAYRELYGTWYIQSFCNMVLQWAHLDIKDILSKVSEDVKWKSNIGENQLPVFESYGFNKKFFINKAVFTTPKINEPNYKLDSRVEVEHFSEKARQSLDKQIEVVRDSGKKADKNAIILLNILAYVLHTGIKLDFLKQLYGPIMRKQPEEDFNSALQILESNGFVYGICESIQLNPEVQAVRRRQLQRVNKERIVLEELLSKVCRFLPGPLNLLTTEEERDKQNEMSHILRICEFSFRDYNIRKKFEDFIPLISYRLLRLRHSFAVDFFYHYMESFCQTGLNVFIGAQDLNLLEVPDPEMEILGKINACNSELATIVVPTDRDSPMYKKKTRLEAELAQLHLVLKNYEDAMSWYVTIDVWQKSFVKAKLAAKDFEVLNSADFWLSFVQYLQTQFERAMYYSHLGCEKEVERIFVESWGESSTFLECVK